MRLLRYNQTLLFYDGVQIFEAHDAIGGHYLCLLIKAEQTSDEYFAIGISPEKLRLFKSGEFDLRGVITSRELKEWFKFTVADIKSDLEAIEQVGEISEEIMPLEDFFISPKELNPEPVIIETKERNNAVLEISIDPPESETASKVHAMTLANIIAIVQTVVKHAYNKSLSTLSNAARKELDVIDAFQLDAFAARPGGSFHVLFEASKGPDLWNWVEIKRALEKLDEITDNAGSPEIALVALQKNKGHLAGAYIKLLEFLIDHRTRFSYRWSAPDIAGSHGRTITPKEAGPLLELFNSTKELGVETMDLHGYLREADSTNGRWRLESIEEGKKTYTGKVKEGSLGVSNLVIDKIYRFHCEEKIEEMVGTSREIRTLLLVDSKEG